MGGNWCLFVVYSCCVFMSCLERLIVMIVFMDVVIDFDVSWEVNWVWIDIVGCSR